MEASPPNYDEMNMTQCPQIPLSMLPEIKKQPNNKPKISDFNLSLNSTSTLPSAIPPRLQLNKIPDIEPRPLIKLQSISPSSQQKLKPISQEIKSKSSKIIHETLSVIKNNSKTIENINISTEPKIDTMNKLMVNMIGCLKEKEFTSKNNENLREIIMKLKQIQNYIETLITLNIQTDELLFSTTTLLHSP